MVAAGDPPVGQQHVAGREIQGLSSAPTMEESEEFKEAVSDTEFEEIAPGGADSRGATATAVGSLNLALEPPVRNIPQSTVSHSAATDPLTGLERVNTVKNVLSSYDSLSAHDHAAKNPTVASLIRMALLSFSRMGQIGRWPN